MPANAVKTERDEHLWDRAKTQAKKQGRNKDYAYIMGIYQRMKGVQKGELIPGGLAAGKNSSEFDPEQLQAGIAVEMEHTKNKKIAREIAMDHLTEDKNYYRKLALIEAQKSLTYDLDQWLEKAARKPIPGQMGLFSAPQKPPQHKTAETAQSTGSGKPRPPAGFMPIKNSKKGGYYKMSGGKRIYWYPDKQSGKKKGKGSTPAKETKATEGTKTDIAEKLKTERGRIDAANNETKKKIEASVDKTYPLLESVSEFVREQPWNGTATTYRERTDLNEHEIKFFDKFEKLVKEMQSLKNQPVNPKKAEEKIAGLERMATQVERRLSELKQRADEEWKEAVDDLKSSWPKNVRFAKPELGFKLDPLERGYRGSRFEMERRLIHEGILKKTPEGWYVKGPNFEEKPSNDKRDIKHHEDQIDYHAAQKAKFRDKIDRSAAHQAAFNAHEFAMEEHGSARNAIKEGRHDEKKHGVNSVPRHQKSARDATQEAKKKTELADKSFVPDKDSPLAPHWKEFTQSHLTNPLEKFEELKDYGHWEAIVEAAKRVRHFERYTEDNHYNYIFTMSNDVIKKIDKIAKQAKRKLKQEKASESPQKPSQSAGGKMATVPKAAKDLLSMSRGAHPVDVRYIEPNQKKHVDHLVDIGWLRRVDKNNVKITDAGRENMLSKKWPSPKKEGTSPQANDANLPKSGQGPMLPKTANEIEKTGTYQLWERDPVSGLWSRGRTVDGAYFTPGAEGAKYFDSDKHYITKVQADPNHDDPEEKEKVKFKIRSLMEKHYNAEKRARNKKKIRDALPHKYAAGKLLRAKTTEQIQEAIENSEDVFKKTGIKKSMKNTDELRKDHSPKQIKKLADRVMGGDDLDDIMKELGDDDSTKRLLLAELRSRSTKKSQQAYRIGIGDCYAHVAEDETLSKALEAADGLILGETDELKKGTIYQGESVPLPEMGITYQRNLIAAQIAQDDPAGFEGQGGLAEWWADAKTGENTRFVQYAPQPPVRVVEPTDPIMYKLINR